MKRLCILLLSCCAWTSEARDLLGMKPIARCTSWRTSYEVFADATCQSGLVKVKRWNILLGVFPVIIESTPAGSLLRIYPRKNTYPVPKMTIEKGHNLPVHGTRDLTCTADW